MCPELQGWAASGCRCLWASGAPEHNILGVACTLPQRWLRVAKKEAQVGGVEMGGGGGHYFCSGRDLGRRQPGRDSAWISGSRGSPWWPGGICSAAVDSASVLEDSSLSFVPVLIS